MCSFLVTRSFYWYQNICPCDLGHLWNWPLSRAFVFHKHILFSFVGADQDLLESSDDKHMFKLVLAWARENVDPKKPRIEDLTEQVDLEIYM